MAENRFIAPEAEAPNKNRNASLFAWTNRFKDDKTRRVVGVCLGVFGFYLLLSFVYHLTYAGAADQSAVQYGPLQADVPTQNDSGSLGAWFANRFITRGFGFVAVLFPLYLMLLGYAVHQKRHFSLLKKLFLLMAFVAYWVSGTMALFNRWFDIGYTDLGGYVGEYLCDTLGRYVGNAGLGLLSFLTLVVFLIVKFNFNLRLTDFLSVPIGRENPVKQDTQTVPGPHPLASNPVSEASDSRDDGIKDDDIKIELWVEEDEVEPAPARVPPSTVYPGAVPKRAAEKDFWVSGVEWVRPPEAKPIVLGEIVDEGRGKSTPNPTFTPEVEPAPTSFTFSPRPVVLGTVDEKEEATRTVSVPTPPAPVVLGTVDEWDTPVFSTQEPETAGGLSLDFVGPVKEAGPNEPPLDGKPKSRFMAVEPPPLRVLSMPVATPPAKPADLELIIETPENERELKEKEFASVPSAPESDYDPKTELSSYKYPSINLLRKIETGGAEIDPEEQERNKMRIIETLLNYGVEITQIRATVGPTITLYEIVPAPGIKISKIKNLEDDIALSLSAKGIRIIAPMPGKGTIGVEIPNAKETVVSFRSVIATQKFRDTQATLPLAIGKTISNEVFVADLAKMPHLLVAGATGQGKSVGLNCMIASLLYKKHPAEIKFVLIDPKKVELTLYKALEKHFLAKLPGLDDAIVTDTKYVVHVLTSLCIEMDNRYQKLQKARVRNIVEYNAKFTARQLNPQKGHAYMPYIVLVIDELADLMMTAGKEIEHPIARLAQLARAVGIHLIVATQRPSVNVITGIIKANFPARLSYKVMSKIDSRTILDVNGAEQLIGKGDLLLFTGSELIRIQNSYIDTAEVEALVDYIASQPSFGEAYMLPEVAMGGTSEEGGNDGRGGELESRDPMFEEAARIVVRNRAGSTSFIQRRLSLGYARAGRIMDQLQAVGIVGPADGSKPREVLVSDERELERFFS